ncbi:MAG: transglycosylase domain-containing protein [Candidatus Absconditicoccaceae bacterium]
MKNYNIGDLHHSKDLSPIKRSPFLKSKHFNYQKKIWSKTILLKIIGRGFASIFVIGFILARIYIYSDLPDVSKVKDMVFSQATIIQDRNGKELYKVFAENREYIDFSGINNNMINAIVAVEDQRYREHSGLDPMGLLRAAIKKVLNPSSRMQGASTIPQQLVRNLLLTKDRKIQRKLKEMVLTKKLNGVIENRVTKEKGELTASELKKQMKDKTLELYLNYISFGNNAFGIESAAKTYFGIPAKDLNVLQSAILSSLPKGPSLYDPYKNRELLMGKIDVVDGYGNQISLDQSFVSTPTTLGTGSTGGATAMPSNNLKDQILIKFQQGLTSADLSNKKNANSFIKFIEGLGSFNVFYNGQEYTIKYKNGRKDLALGRMYEDGYIQQDELKNSFLQGLNYEFAKNTFPIKAPHFVQWIIEQLEEQYGKEMVTKGGLLVTTTLDYDIQQLAESALLDNVNAIQDNGANNSSLIYIDSYSGDVLAYVGSIDYFNEKIQGQNDMVRRARQSGSSIKPFIYALGFEKLPLTLDTPIYDIPFQIGPDRPNNADDKFEGLLPLKYALGHSRNIPSTKMLLGLGGEEEAKPFLNKLGLSGVSAEIPYGYTLALGAAEVTMLELATAYSNLTMGGKPAYINPILEIKSSNGSIVYQKVVQYRDQVIKPGVVYLMRKILADPANRIVGRVNKFNVKGLTYALKTGTSNVKTEKGNRPRDGRLAAYTPNKVLLFWAGNADATPMNRNAYGGTIHANPVKKIMGELLAKGYIKNEEMTKVEVAGATISKISGKLAGANTPADLTVSTMGYIKSMPSTTDDGSTAIQYDSSCNGKISPYTPTDQAKNGYIIIPSTFMPNKMDLQEITDRRKQSTQFSGVNPMSGKVSYTYNNIFVEEPKEFCPGRSAEESADIKVSIIKPLTNASISAKTSIRFDITSPKAIKNVNILVDQIQVGSFEYPSGRKNISDIKSIDIKNIKDGKHILQLIAIDDEGFSNSATIEINITSSDKQAPFMVEDKTVVKVNEDGTYAVMILFDDALSAVSGGKFFGSSGEVINEFKNNFASFQVSSLSTISFEVKDAYGNILNQSLDLNKYLK